MEERVVDYFVVAGLPDEIHQQVDDDLCEGLNPNQQNIEPITDITVIFPTLGEYVPKGFGCVEHTPSGYPANLNSGSIRSPEVYLCYRRGRDKPPLVDIGVMYDGKERLLPDAEVVLSSPEGRPANVNNTSARTLLTFRRAPENMPCNELVVTDICVIFQNKGEKPPHAFCLIQKNLNKGMMGCDVFLCYKKSMYRPPLLPFKPEVLLRYPPIDRKNFPFPPLTATFCLPMCATIECWPKNSLQPRPVFSTFVLTVADATEQIYGAAITFYEEYLLEEKLTEEQKVILGYNTDIDKSAKSLHVNKTCCLLSHHPFFDAFKTFLFYLNWMMRNGPHETPIERYISHLLDDVPFPSVQRPNILMQLSPTQNILLSHPQESPLPKSGASFRAMLNNLGKLLIHSLRPDILTAVAEAISVLIFPFHWQCPFIPLCPLGLCGVLQAPVPFLIGVDSRFFDLYEPPSDVTCIDLDTTSVTVSEDKKHLLNVKILPKKPARVLRNTLDTIKMVSDRMSFTGRGSLKGRNDAAEAMDIDFQQKRRERMIEMEIQEAFLRFMSTILKGYRQFLLPITQRPTIGATDASSLFDFQGFLRSRDKTYQKFYQLMLKTQMFIRFIEERSFVSENDSSLEFFDECVDKVEADEAETVKLLDTGTEGSQSERTVFVMPPEPIGLAENELYSYNCRFNMKEGLFGLPKLKSQSMHRVLQTTDHQQSPGSPVARRTKQEIRSAQKIAKKYSEKPQLWAKYLLSTCYSIWFIHLPSYSSLASSKHMALCMAYEMLVRMGNCGLQPADEVCYRVMMQLCGLYNQPVIAVKVLLKMKRCGLTPNAITYGYYNKAVLEAEWPSNVSNSSQLMWHKLRNVILGVAHFRSAVKPKNIGDTVDSDRVSTGSGISLESQLLAARSVTRTPISNVNMQRTTEIRNKSQSDSEVTNVATPVPTRISSSSDIGYCSMHDKASSDDIADPEFVSQNEKQAKATKFWGKMGQSLDMWVKSGVSSLASLAVDSYYQPHVLMEGFAGFGDYTANISTDQDDEDEDEDELEDNIPKKFENKGKSRKRLDFSEDEKTESQTMRLLRSVSFGNDTQIMSKLKLLRNELIPEKTSNQQPGQIKSVETSEAVAINQRRSASVESNSSSSLEAKVNEYYNPSSESRDTSVEKSIADSREFTPEGSHESYQDTLRPDSLNPPKSPSIQIRSKNLSNDVTSSPSRTPVTQDDPLGALSESCSPDNKDKDTMAVKSTNLIQPSMNRDSPKRTCSEGHLGVLNEIAPMGPPPTIGFHRSSTLPNYGSEIGDRAGSNLSMSSEPSDEKLGNNGIGAAAAGVSGLTVFSSNLKNPFGRYSPGRLSLRKAGSSFIESTIGGKKAEAIMEGFNQFKSAATVTVKTKLEELKEAVGNNSTPGRTGPFGRYDDSRYDENEDGEPEPLVNDQWASVSESYLDHILTTEQGSTRASVDYGDSPISSSRNSLLFVEQFKNASTGPTTSNIPRTISLEINMTTCSICHNCSSLLFDEEIMAGWTAEDSNLNTRCPHCKKWEVPFLEVTVIDYRHNPMPQLPNLTATTAPSLESVSLSRRTSFVTPNITSNPSEAPPSQVSKADMVQLEIESNSKNTTAYLQVSELDGISSAETIELDPLGVLEKNQRSRRASPEVDILPPGNLESMEENKASLSSKSVSATNIGAGAASTTMEYSENVEPVIQLEGVNSDPIIVPYLSPLVLRKELENVLDQEGDSCLVQPQFVDEHPIIFWNLVWFFHRSNLPSHVKGLTLQAKSITQNKMARKLKKSEEHQTTVEEKGDGSQEEEFEPFSIHSSWDGVDHRSVVVNCNWDNPKYHDQFTVPLYMEWLKMKEKEKGKSESKTDEAQQDDGSLDNKLSKLISNILRAASTNSLSQTCPQLLYHYHKQPKSRHFPTYRDILFLSVIAVRDSFEATHRIAQNLQDGYGYDKEYRDVYSKLRCNDDYESMDIGDLPPSDAALFCRRYFRELQLPAPK